MTEAFEAFGTPRTGLSDPAVGALRAQWGPNRLETRPPRSWISILAEQFASLLVALLAVGAALSFGFGQWLEGVAILVVLALNAAIGFTTELRAVRSMEALRNLVRTHCTVRRGGRVERINADEVVPGDLVLIEGGDVVAADLRLVSGSRLQVDEAALTGESVPADKTPDVIQPDVPLAERANMLYQGTAVTRGTGEGVAVATGMDTELGRISRLVAEAGQEQRTPLERRLARLGHRLIWLTLIVAAAVVVMGALSGKNLLVVIETAIALAVAAVPEGLPIIATITLARGVGRMAARRALMRRLTAVETLGSTGVILTDKTGTLTEHRMTVTWIGLPEGDVSVNGGFRLGGTAIGSASVTASTLDRFLRAGVLCNNAQRDRDGTGIGDPLEVALLDVAARRGLDRPALLNRHPEVREEAFDPELKMMATVHRDGDTFLIAAKGAPEAVLPRCTAVADPTNGTRALHGSAWAERAERMAREGLRVLALAEKSVETPPGDVFAGLTLLGLVGLLDPPREDVGDAIRSCRAAGIRVVMVTGDHPATAWSIARTVGIADEADGAPRLGSDIEREPAARLRAAAVFARVAPEQKLRLLRVHQAGGAIVAMTGDGVNDAPALKQADIGIAMGHRGTEVAREAADMVLEDDAFSTIVAAVEEGRVIFDKIRRFTLFLLSCNLSEVLLIGMATALRAPLPLLPLQILYINLVTDVFPALALGSGPGDPRIMRRPPRSPTQPILGARHWRRIAGYGLLLTASVLGAFFVALDRLGMDYGRAVTVSFLTVASGQLWHTFDMRAPGTGFFTNDVIRNPWIWGAVAVCWGLLLAAAFVPGLSSVLHTDPIGGAGWMLVLGFGLAPTVLTQLTLLLGRRRRSDRQHLER